MIRPLAQAGPCLSQMGMAGQCPERADLVLEGDSLGSFHNYLWKNEIPKLHIILLAFTLSFAQLVK